MSGLAYLLTQDHGYHEPNERDQGLDDKGEGCHEQALEDYHDQPDDKKDRRQEFYQGMDNRCMDICSIGNIRVTNDLGHFFRGALRIETYLMGRLWDPGGTSGRCICHKSATIVSTS